MQQEKFNLIHLVNNSGCFDLQFRKDVRHERTGSPTYYRWKLQFIITAPKENIAALEHAQKELACGAVTVVKEQARLSVQNIDEIHDVVIPHFTKNKLAENKKKDFELWVKAAAIIYKNKGKKMTSWEKTDLVQLLDIHKAGLQYKEKPRKQKWLDMAQTFANQPEKKS